MFLAVAALALASCNNAPAGTEALTVKNYLQWCSVAVNGQSASSSASQTLDVTPGGITVVATPLAGFELGSTPWHDTDGDSGGGDPGARTGTQASATVTVGSAAKCVWVCCETVGQHDCPATDQCP